MVIIKYDRRVPHTLQSPCNNGIASVSRELPALELVTKEHLVLGLDHLVDVLLADLGLHEATALPGLGDVNNLVNHFFVSSNSRHLSWSDVERGVQIIYDGGITLIFKMVYIIQGCTNRCSLAAGLRRKEERMRK